MEPGPGREPSSSSTSSKPSHALAPRPPQPATLGMAITIWANHHRLKFQPKKLFHYNVTISPEVPRGLNRPVVKELMEAHGAGELNNALIAYDGQNSLYTARPLKEHLELDVELPETDDNGCRRRKRNFKVILREVSRPDLQLLGDFLSGRPLNLPQEALQALDVVLREAAVSFFFQRGRSFFGPNFGVTSLGGGVEAYNGFYQSIRPAQDGLLTLNLDIAAAPFFESVRIPDFLGKVFNLSPRDLDQELSRLDARGDTARVKAKKLLKGVRVETIHNTNGKQIYRVQGISDQPVGHLVFDMNGEEISVVDYFMRAYNYRIELRGLPALVSGSKERKRYLPMEVCKICKGQPYLKALNEMQRRSLLMATCLHPEQRRSKTEEIGKQLVASTYKYTEEFGVLINRFLTQIPARVLPAPKILYHSMEENPKQGNWNLKGKVMFQGCKISRWSLISLSRSVPKQAVETFCSRLPHDCETYGVHMNPRLAAPWITAAGGNIKDAVFYLNRVCEQQTGEGLEIIICIMPKHDNKSLYAAVKRVCEIELGVLTQCCLEDNVKKCNFQYLANLTLKINAKLGGRNALLSDVMNKSLPLISEVPSIIIGADVSHPRMGDDHSPSISAVAASMDPYFSKYESITSSQSKRCEVLEGLYWEKEENGQRKTGGIIKDLLCSFLQKTGQIPLRIIYYRDGVSDGQFDKVLSHEYEAVKKAYDALESEYMKGKDDEPLQKKPRSTNVAPKVTFIVVQKRHHTRFFPQPITPSTSNGNILPGTVVDSVICHPTQFDFFLCSHQGIKGTSKPAHYHVLKDENGFSTDEIQRLTNDLCFTYVRCTRAVSVVPPCYYAHLAATRARLWIDSDSSSDTGSLHEKASTIASGDSSRTAVQSRSVQPLPSLHQRIKGTMFYI